MPAKTLFFLNAESEAVDAAHDTICSTNVSGVPISAQTEAKKSDGESKVFKQAECLRDASVPAKEEKEAKKNRSECHEPDVGKAAAEESVYATIGVGKNEVQLEEDDRQLIKQWEQLFWDEIMNVRHTGAAPEEPSWLPIYPSVGLPDFSFTAGAEY